MSFKQFLIEYKTTKDLTAKQLAVKLHVPIRTVQHWVLGDRVPSEFVQEQVKKILEKEF